MWQHFAKSSTELNGFTTPEKRAPIPIHSTPADQFVSPYLVSLPQQPLKQWGKVKHLLAISYIGLFGSYIQNVISMFNTCSQGLTHHSLINTDGGYNLGGTDFPHHTTRPSKLTVLCFPLMTMSDLRLTILNISF
jgi:hypothetical protein